MLFQGLRDQQARRSLEGRSNKMICDILELIFAEINYIIPKSNKFKMFETFVVELSLEINVGFSQFGARLGQPLFA
jgi:hypothetical protein